MYDRPHVPIESAQDCNILPLSAASQAPDFALAPPVDYWPEAEAAEPLPLPSDLENVTDRTSSPEPTPEQPTEPTIPIAIGANALEGSRPGIGDSTELPPPTDLPPTGFEHVEPDPFARTWAGRHPQTPNVQVEVHLAPHGTARDGAALLERVRHGGADVLLYENASGNHNPLAERVTKAVEHVRSQDHELDDTELVERVVDTLVAYTADDEVIPVRGNAQEVLVRAMLEHPELSIDVCDVEADSQRRHELLAEELIKRTNRYEILPSLENTLKRALDNNKAIVALQADREEYAFGPLQHAEDKPVVAGLLEHKLLDKIEASPELSEKARSPEGVRAVVAFGLSHRLIPQRIEASGLPVTVSYGDTLSERLTYDTELQLRLAKGEPVDPLLVEKTYGMSVMMSLYDERERVESNPDARISNGAWGDYFHRLATVLPREVLEQTNTTRWEMLRQDASPQGQAAVRAAMQQQINTYLVAAGHPSLAKNEQEVQAILDTWNPPQPEWNPAVSVVHRLPSTRSIILRSLAKSNRTLPGVIGEGIILGSQALARRRRGHRQ